MSCFFGAVEIILNRLFCSLKILLLLSLAKSPSEPKTAFHSGEALHFSGVVLLWQEDFGKQDDEVLSKKERNYG